MSEQKTSATHIVLPAFLALAVAMGIGRFAFTPLLPMMMDAGVSLAEGGWLATANYAGYLLGALTAGWLPTRRVGLVMRGSLAGIIITTMLMAWTQHFAAWMVLRALAGIASALVMVHVSAWSLRELAHSKRADLSARAFGGVGTGIIAAGLLVMLLSASGAGAADAWLLCSLLALCMTAAAWRGLRGESVASQPLPASAQGNPHGLRLVLCYGAYGLGYIIPATFLPALARQSMPDPVLFNAIWPLFGGMTLMSALLAERLQHRFTPLALWTGSHLFMAAGVALLALPHSATAIVLSALCVGGTFLVPTLAGFQVARQLTNGDATRLIAAMTAAFATGQIVGPLLLAWTARTPGVGASLALAATALLISAASLWQIRQIRTRRA